MTPTMSSHPEFRAYRMPDTAMAEAFRKVGVSSPEGRLDELMRKALEANKGRVGATTIEGFFKLLEAENSCALYGALFVEYRERAAGKLMAQALEALRRERPAIVAREIQRGPETPAPRVTTDWDRFERPRAASPAAGRKAIERIATSWVLDTVVVGGVALRRASAGTCRMYASSTLPKVRLIAALAEGLSDQAVIGDHWTDDAAQRRWEEILQDSVR